MSADEWSVTGEAQVGAESEVGIEWVGRGDATVLADLGAGFEPEPLLVDYCGNGPRDLLLTSRDATGRWVTHLFPAGPASAGEPPAYGAGRHLPDLDGLHALGVVPRPGGDQLDIVGLAAGELLILTGEGPREDQRFPRRRSLGRVDTLFGEHMVVRQVLATDWDGDGLTDLLVTLEDQSGYWPADLDATPEPQRLGVDVDGQIPGHDDRSRWQGRPPRTRFVWMRQQPPREGEPPAFEAPEPLDLAERDRETEGSRAALVPLSWRGRGSWECIGIDPAGRARIYRNFGGQRPPILMEPEVILEGSEPLVLPPDRTIVVPADLNADRRDELVFGGGDGRVWHIRHASTRDSSAAPAVPLRCADPRLWIGAGAVIAAADLDADGDCDLVAGDASGRLRMVEDQGGPGHHRHAAPAAIDGLGLPLQLEPGPHGLPGGPAAPRLGQARPCVVDWKANGRPDILVSGSGGMVFLLRNNGGRKQPRFDRPEPILAAGKPLLLPPRVQPAVAVWGEAGALPSLVGLDPQGFLCLYPRLDVMEVGEAAYFTDTHGRLIRLDGAYAHAGHCALWVGPWTGPGRRDILACLAPPAWGLLPLITGDPDTRADALPGVLLLTEVEDRVVRPCCLRLRDLDPAIPVPVLNSACGFDWRDSGSLDLVGSTAEGRVVAIPRTYIAG